MTEELLLTSNSEEETVKIGGVIGKLLHAGDFVALTGHLGAGKTHLTKGLVAGLDFEHPNEVNSPTFVLINEYSARLQVYHIDAYRLHSGEELFSLGFEEMLEKQAVVILEWADRVSSLIPENALWIELSSLGEFQRQLKMHSKNARLMQGIASIAGLDQWRRPDDKTT